MYLSIPQTTPEMRAGGMPGPGSPWAGSGRGTSAMVTFSASKRRIEVVSKPSLAAVIICRPRRPTPENVISPLSSVSPW